MEMDNRIEKILKFWFGRIEETILPTENRAKIWFGENPEVDEEIKTSFGDLLSMARFRKLDNWIKMPRGQLALIILLDQFSRHIYRETPAAYEQDAAALSVCLDGLNKEFDHQLSLIERVFFYFPLLHAEDIHCQEKSVKAYKTLSEMAFLETRVIYESFLKFANHHYTLIQKFGRFPQRNKILGRNSTPEERLYLNEIKSE